MRDVVILRIELVAAGRKSIEYLAVGGGTQILRATHFQNAWDELDAVVAATEEATNTIMNCCDDISAIAGKVGGEDGDALMNNVTKMFEACNFQDITGQRIGKVVKTLRYIETHINQLVELFGKEIGSHSRAAVGVAQLPFGVAVEVEALFEIA